MSRCWPSPRPVPVSPIPKGPLEEFSDDAAGTWVGSPSSRVLGMTAVIVAGMISTALAWIGSLLQAWVSMRAIRGIVSDHLPGSLPILPAAPSTNRYAYLLVRILFYPPWRRGQVAEAIQQAQGWLVLSVGAAVGFGAVLTGATEWIPWVWILPLVTVPMVLWICGSYVFDDGDELRAFLSRGNSH